MHLHLFRKHVGMPLRHLPAPLSPNTAVLFTIQQALLWMRILQRLTVAIFNKKKFGDEIRPFFQLAIYLLFGL